MRRATTCSRCSSIPSRSRCGPRPPRAGPTGRRSSTATPPPSTGPAPPSGASSSSSTPTPSCCCRARERRCLVDERQPHDLRGVQRHLSTPARHDRVVRDARCAAGRRRHRPDRRGLGQGQTNGTSRPCEPRCRPSGSSNGRRRRLGALVRGPRDGRARRPVPAREHHRRVPPPLRRASHVGRSRRGTRPTSGLRLLKQRRSRPRACRAAASLAGARLASSANSGAGMNRAGRRR